jgi:hypothetical protein
MRVVRRMTLLAGLPLRPALLALTAVFLAAPALGAQELAPGTRVRVTAPIVRGDSRFVGTVTSTDSGRIRLRLDPELAAGHRADTISIPRSLVRRLEVSLGRPGRSRSRGARTGGLAGLVAGVGLGLALGNESDRQGLHNPWTTSLWLGPTVGAVGAGAGALLGGSNHEEWRMLRPPRVALALGRSTTVSIRLSF